MMTSVRRAVVTTVCAVALLAVPGCDRGEKSGGGGSSKEVEVFTWWSEGGEKAGLDALVDVFDTGCPNYKFVNGAVAGGAGSNAKQVLASRLQQNEPPDTFQVHAGMEVLDYVNSGQLEDLSPEYQQWGLNQAFPKGLLAAMTFGGRIYSVPANIHRANIVWTNKSVLANAGITTVPNTVDELIGTLETLRSKGTSTPLAVGKDWTQLMLLEAILISGLGAEKFMGLWSGSTDWNGPEVAKSINDYQKVLSYSNKDRDTLDWSDAEKLLIENKAAFQVMGDWEAADLDAKGFKDYGYFVFPGNGNAFQWLADSFVLPKGAKNVPGTKCWLQTVASPEGQKAFNIKKGSIPARADSNPDDYPPYQRSAIAAWKTGIQVPSCAHGSACQQGLQGTVSAALVKFASDGDVAGLQKTISIAITQFVKK